MRLYIPTGTPYLSLLIIGRSTHIDAPFLKVWDGSCGHGEEPVQRASVRAAGSSEAESGPPVSTPQIGGISQLKKSLTDVLMNKYKA